VSRNGAWIQTFSGVAFYPLDPRPGDIHITDIAHSLAMQCRFTGHSRKFYSVAEHSVHVSRLCDPADALWGLLHDASEAYLTDMARPIKRYTALGVAYKQAEHRLMVAVTDRFGLLPAEPSSVCLADKILMGVEARDLMAPLLPGWEKWLDMAKACDLQLIEPWLPDEAEQRFLARYCEIREL
jgi:hypothetical protein